MIRKLLLLLAVAAPLASYSQKIKSQYFDGADTMVINSIVIELDTASSNIWQIGKPQKTIFDSAATLPNAIVTDTVNYYPPGNISRFSFSVNSGWWGNWGILALRWKQKIDFDSSADGGLIEYSTDTGKTWKTVFNSPYTYNFYGYDTTNVDTIFTGETGFTGTDTTWRDIWLCFDKSFLSGFGIVSFRFTLKSDAVHNNREGWMIDNMKIQTTWTHTVKKMADDQYLRIYPTKTTGIVNIEAQKLQEYHIIKNMQLIDMQGKVVQEYGLSPTKFFIDISNQPDGTYRLKINTNKKTETFPVILSR